MSIDNSPTVKLQAPYSVYLAQTLTDTERDIIATYLRLLPNDCIKDIYSDVTDITDSVTNDSTLKINNLVDGRGLACPMPLLKTKVALRTIANGEALYVLATDPNSQADIMAFCRQTQQTNNAPYLTLLVNQASNRSTNQSAMDKTSPTADTIFHFIITKTDSN